MIAVNVLCPCTTQLFPHARTHTTRPYSFLHSACCLSLTHALLTPVHMQPAFPSHSSPYLSQSSVYVCRAPLVASHLPPPLLCCLCWSCSVTPCTGRPFGKGVCSSRSSYPTSSCELRETTVAGFLGLDRSLRHAATLGMQQGAHM